MSDILLFGGVVVLSVFVSNLLYHFIVDRYINSLDNRIEGFAQIEPNKSYVLKIDVNTRWLEKNPNIDKDIAAFFQKNDAEVLLLVDEEK